MNPLTNNNQLHYTNPTSANSEVGTTTLGNFWHAGAQQCSRLFLCVKINLTLWWAAWGGLAFERRWSVSFSTDSGIPAQSATNLLPLIVAASNQTRGYAHV